MKNLLNLAFFISFLFLNLNANSYNELYDVYFKDLNCSKFEFKKSGEKFSVDDLNLAILNNDESLVLKILGSDKNLSFKQSSNSKTPFFINLKNGNNILIEEMLLCADKRVFDFEIYAPSIVLNKEISENETIKILNSLFSQGLDKNAVFYYQDLTLLRVAFNSDKFKVFEYLLDTGSVVNESLGDDIWFSFTQIFRDENLSLNVKNSPSKEVINLLNSQKYKAHREKILNLTKKATQKGLKNLKYLYQTFDYLGDEVGKNELINLGFTPNF
ncbi:hypothetical protein [Campylobacter corcagiensis]|uniref:Ankyrin repeat domain-containing protein n=1 Tax=Campylobacter corcagiensis TaxID=1448857 RepID=A0A7M1LIJ6_9BACT|nr:hypothetical protein [Campylobacter corcagiensis]QKF64495.1 hypothetical protein CCORG_0627 [Campylobacter corcagiensis]QOQ87325.1 hypothetical protein IMC76_00425 [Campylobacter corcagiensis]